MSIPVVHHFGHGMIGHVPKKNKMVDQEVAWNVLGGGKFKTPKQLSAGTDLRADAAPSEADIALATVLAEMAEELGQPGNLTGGTSKFRIRLSISCSILRDSARARVPSKADESQWPSPGLARNTAAASPFWAAPRRSTSTATSPRCPSP